MPYRLFVLIGCLVAAGLNLGCAGPIYKPFDGNVGYSEAVVEPGLIDVIYQGPTRLGAGTSFELAKVRAAEITLDKGKEYFRIIDRDIGTRTDVDVDYSNFGFTTGVGLGYGRRGYGRGGVGVYQGRYPSYDVNRRPVAYLTVELLDEPNDKSFTAQQVIDEAYANELIEPDED